MVSVAIPLLLFGGMKLTAITLRALMMALFGSDARASELCRLAVRTFLLVSSCGLDSAPAGGL